MSRFTKLTGLCLAALLGGALAATAHIRLITGAGGPPLFWSTPWSISIVISSAGSADIADSSETTAIRNAIHAWNEDTMTLAQLVENTSSVQQARTDWDADDIHLVLFDENNTSGFFPGVSGTVAITPVSFFANGQIADADVIYNGKDFQFTTSGQVGDFDVMDIGTHELGHLLGLDHSGLAGATMYPWVDSGVIAHRSLSVDDRNGLRDAYPSGLTGAFTGTVRRLADSSIAQGAQVVAVDVATGRTAGSALANDSGFFRLTGLPAGNYEFWAEPLDTPVSIANLTPGHTIDVDFSATQFAPQVVSSGQTISLGNLLVDADAAIQLGMPFNPLPIRLTADGMARFETLDGMALVPGSTLQCNHPGVTVSNAAFTGSSVTFQVSAPMGTTPGHADLVVIDVGGLETDVLPAALEITPPDPTVTNVSPGSGPGTGGTALTITGTGFNAGAQVLIGDNIYRDGLDAVVANATTIALTTAPTENGTHDVVVMDATGVEGRLASGFQSVVQPMVTSVFPVAGDVAGGTSMRIRGADFTTGVTVFIDGVQQTSVTLTDSMTLDVVTNAGVPGGPYVLEVRNPGGGMATAAFSYVAQADPVVNNISPATGPAGESTTVTVTGTGFTANTTVRFGVDPDTGAGGTPAPSITLMGPTTLQVDSPALAGGLVSVLVADLVTNQASVLPDAFTFTGIAPHHGACNSIGAPPPGPPDVRDVLAGSLWLLVAVGAALVFARRERARLSTTH